MAALLPFCFPTHNQYETGSEAPRVALLLNLNSHNNPPSFFLFCDLSTGPLLGVNIALLARNPPLQGQSSINKLSGPEGVHACACVCLCVSVCLPPLLRLESWIWRSSWLCSVTHTQHQTRDESDGVGAAPRPRPARFQPWTSTFVCWGQDQRRWRWSDAGQWGGVGLTGVCRPQTDSYKIWITHPDWKLQIPMDSLCFTTWF